MAMIKKNMALDAFLKIPLYIQLSNCLLQSILENEIRFNDMLPTEKDLCEMYDVSLSVVKAAYNRLKADNYIKTQRGKGAFVSYRPRFQINIDNLLLLNHLSPQNMSIRQTFVINEVQASEILSMELNVINKASLIVFKQLIILDNNPIGIQSFYLPKEDHQDFHSSKIWHESFRTYLSQNEHTKLYNLVNTYSASHLTLWQSKLLSVPDDSASIVTHSLGLNKNGTPICYIITHVPSNHVELEFDTYVEI